MICDIAWFCKSILYFEQHTAVILTLCLFSCFIVWLRGLPTTAKAPPPHKSGPKTSRQEGGLHPCKWVLLVKHNFVDEAVAAITTGLTNVEEEGEMEVQVLLENISLSAFVSARGETTERIR